MALDEGGGIVFNSSDINQRRIGSSSVQFGSQSSQSRAQERAAAERRRRDEARRRQQEQQMRARQAEMASIRRAEESARLMRTAAATQSLLRPDQYYTSQGTAFAQSGIPGRQDLPSFDPRTPQDLVRFEQQMQLQRFNQVNQASGGESFGGGLITRQYGYDPTTGQSTPRESRIPGYYEDYYMRSQAGRDARIRYAWQERMSGLADAWSQYQQVILPPPIDEGYTDLGDGGGGGGGWNWPSYGGYGGGSYNAPPRWLRNMAIWNI